MPIILTLIHYQNCKNISARFISTKRCKYCTVLICIALNNEHWYIL